MKKSILIVDDDKRLRELLKDYLSEKKFEVYLCEDFIEAKEILNIFQDEIQVPKWVASEENSESFNNFLNKLSKMTRNFL